MKTQKISLVLPAALFFSWSARRSPAEAYTVDTGISVSDTPFLTATAPDASSVNTQEVKAAPFNPEFIAFMQRQNRLAVTNEGQDAFGWIPAPVSITDRLGEMRPITQALRSAPSAYDLRALGRVTSIKNQNPWATCWSFGAYASMESCLRTEETRDFSEKNLVNLHGFDYGYNEGGQAMMSMAYLFRRDGPINESDDPYPTGTWSGSPSKLTVQKHARQVQIIPGKTSATDNAAIKQAVMDHGALVTTYHHNNTYYNSSNSTYYFTGSAMKNHGVAIVGWDDNFDRTEFVTPAPTNGAYIVKNSWGSNWGDDGYFYVSYCDTLFARKDMYCFLSAESADTYHTVYQHDPLGWISSANSPWAAAIYTAIATETLKAVGFYCDASTTSYSLYIYTGVSSDAPRSGTLACSMSGSLAVPGFHTLPLTTPVDITTGQRFSVVLHLGGTSSYPQAIEYAVPGYSSAATAEANETHYSFNGISFSDLTSWNTTASFCLKAYTAQDSDSDSIPDWWEALYFGHASNCVWYADADFDGQNNRDEYIAGMNPTNPASRFIITNCIPLSGSVHFVIEWQSVSGRVYNTLWTTNLKNSFQPLETNIFYPRNSSTDTVHGVENKCFYKVEVYIQ